MSKSKLLFISVLTPFSWKRFLLVRFALRWTSSPVSEGMDDDHPRFCSLRPGSIGERRLRGSGVDSTTRGASRCMFSEQRDITHSTLTRASRNSEESGDQMKLRDI